MKNVGIFGNSSVGGCAIFYPSSISTLIVTLNSRLTKFLKSNFHSTNIVNTIKVSSNKNVNSLFWNCLKQLSTILKDSVNFNKHSWYICFTTILQSFEGWGLHACPTIILKHGNTDSLQVHKIKWMSNRMLILYSDLHGYWCDHGMKFVIILILQIVWVTIISFYRATKITNLWAVLPSQAFSSSASDNLSNSNNFSNTETSKEYIILCLQESPPGLLLCAVRASHDKC